MSEQIELENSELENNKKNLLENLKDKTMEQQCFSSLKNQMKQLLNCYKSL